MEKNNRILDKEEIIYIIDRHKHWLKTKGEQGKRAIFSGYTILDYDFSSENLIEVNFEKTYLYGVSFDNCILNHCNFNSSIIKNTCFYKAEAIECDFNDAVMQNCNFIKANLTDSSFVQADIFCSDFCSSICQYVNFYNSNIKESHFTYANLRGASFLEANLYKNNLSKAILIDVEFKWCNLEKTEGLIKVMGVEPGNIYWKRIREDFTNNGYTFKLGLNELKKEEVFASDERVLCSYPGFHFASRSWCAYYYPNRPYEVKIRIPEDAQINEPWATDGKASADKIEILEIYLAETGENITNKFR